MKQTDSKYPHIRGWGCYLCTLAYIAGVRDIAIVDKLYPVLKSLGYIKDNSIPTSEKGWYRCFVAAPAACVHYLSKETGKEKNGKELSRHPHNPEPSIARDWLYIIKEIIVGNGSHFVVSHPEWYNPDERIKDGQARSYRVWSVV